MAAGFLPAVGLATAETPQPGTGVKPELAQRCVAWRDVGEDFTGVLSAPPPAQNPNHFADWISGATKPAAASTGVLRVFRWAAPPRAILIMPTTARKVRYTAVLNLPPLPADQLAGLRDNIAVASLCRSWLTPTGRAGKSSTATIGRQSPMNSGTLSRNRSPRFGRKGETHPCPRAGNLARRQLDQSQKRQLIADQLNETPGKSLRWIGKMLGVAAHNRWRVFGTNSLQLVEIEPVQSGSVGLDGKLPPRGGCDQELAPSPPKFLLLFAR